MLLSHDSIVDSVQYRVRFSYSGESALCVGVCVSHVTIRLWTVRTAEAVQRWVTYVWMFVNYDWKGCRTIRSPPVYYLGLLAGYYFDERKDTTKIRNRSPENRSQWLPNARLHKTHSSRNYPISYLPEICSKRKLGLVVPRVFRTRIWAGKLRVWPPLHSGFTPFVFDVSLVYWMSKGFRFETGLGDTVRGFPAVCQAFYWAQPFTASFLEFWQVWTYKFPARWRWA
jgi:hypothetical protein